MTVQQILTSVLTDPSARTEAALEQVAAQAAAEFSPWLNEA
jgi:hypothetical protein